MKPFFIALAVIAVIFVCIVVAGALMIRKKEAPPIPLTANLRGRIAIVVYSQSKVRNTAEVAEWIKRNTGGDMFSLEMETPYPEPYSETLKAASKDISEGKHPALVDVPDLSGYDIVFLGSPIWYGTYAPPVATFLDSDKLAGKVVAPFCTHGGGGEGHFFADLRKECPEARILDGLVIRGSNQIERRLGVGVTSHHTENDVITWLNSLFPADGPQPQGEQK